jgi:chitinase
MDRHSDRADGAAGDEDGVREVSVKKISTCRTCRHVTKIARTLAFIACAIGGAHPAAQNERPAFRVIGYYSLRAAMTADAASVPFDQLTHINLSFLNPDAAGVFAPDVAAIAPFIDAAHAHQVKVLLSIGGGGPHPYYHDLLGDEKRAPFIARLLTSVEQSGADGADVDLEGGDIDQHYEPFVTELAKALHARRKLITAAIAVFYKDALTDAALAQYDFVNIMSYDHTGPWRPEKPGPHAPYDQADAALTYFGIDRRIPKDKMVLGVPFYGYGFGPDLTSPAVTMSFGQIASTFPGAELVDQWDMPGGRTLYYNGIPTIRRKTQLAKERASGIMIWQILGDAPGEKSLLAAINDAGRK